MNKQIVIRYDIGSSEYYPELVLDKVDHYNDNDRARVEKTVERQYATGFVSFDGGGIIPMKEVRRINWFIRTGDSE